MPCFPLLLVLALSSKWKPNRPRRFKLVSNETGKDLMPHYQDPAGEAADVFAIRLANALAKDDEVDVQEVYTLSKDHYPPAVHVMGELHELGVAPLERNLTEALRLFKKAAMLGYPESYAALSFYLRHGIIEEPDILQSLVYETMAMNGGSVRGMLCAGLGYWLGTERPVSHQRAAVSVFQVALTQVAAAEKGRRTAHTVAPMTLDRRIEQHRVKDQLEMLKSGAENGDVDMSVNLGRAYLEGDLGAEADYEMARNLFEKHLGHPKAKVMLARMKGRGLGMEKNVTEARQMLEELIETDVEAANQLGVIELAEGNQTGACELFRKSGSVNYIVLGMQGVCPKEEDGLRLAKLRMAAEKGLTFAYPYIAFLLLNGRYYNATEAVQNLWKALNQGFWNELSKIAEDAFDNGEYEMALQLWMELGDMGMSNAAKNAATLLRNWRYYERSKDPFGFDEEKRLSEAIRLLKIASIQTKNLAVEIAKTYLDQNDEHKAIKWLRKKDTVECSYRLALLTLQGDEYSETPRNFHKITKYAKRVTSIATIVPAAYLWCRVFAALIAAYFQILTGTISDQAVIDDVRGGLSDIAWSVGHFMVFPAKVAGIMLVMFGLIRRRLRLMYESLE